ncbi:MAG: hypothetical protein U0231_09010 [Nitrospiraceae bacterium]
MLALLIGWSVGTASAGKPELKEEDFGVLTDEHSTHKPGKVQMVEFADFPCYIAAISTVSLPILEKEFGNKLGVTMVGYPVIPNRAHGLRLVA